MENCLSSVCHCLNDMAQTNKVVADSLLSKEEVGHLMGLVDLRRKGYLDLHDVYQLVGTVTEAQLFALFKAMDHTRRGEVSEDDLMVLLGDPLSQSSNTSKEYLFGRFYKVIDTIKDQPNQLAAARLKHKLE